MFNIQSKYGDLLDELATHGVADPVTDIGQAAEELGSEMDTMTDALRDMYHVLDDIESAAQDNALASEFPYVHGISDLDENATAVVTDIITEMASSLMTSIRDLTRFDRVDRR